MSELLSHARSQQGLRSGLATAASGSPSDHALLTSLPHASAAYGHIVSNAKGTWLSSCLRDGLQECQLAQHGQIRLHKGSPAAATWHPPTPYVLFVCREGLSHKKQKEWA